MIKAFIMIQTVPRADDSFIIKKLKERHCTGKGDYCCTVFGQYNLLIEKPAVKLSDVDDFITRVRSDEEINKFIARTITLVGVKQP